MNNNAISGDIVDINQFFAPVSSDLIDGLVGQYQQSRSRIECVAEFMATEVGSVLDYFIEGSKSEWQANMFAGAFLADARHITPNMSLLDISNEFGLGHTSAKIRRDNLKRYGRGDSTPTIK